MVSFAAGLLHHRSDERRRPLPAWGADPARLLGGIRPGGDRRGRAVLPGGCRRRLPQRARARRLQQRAAGGRPWGRRARRRPRGDGGGLRGGRRQPLCRLGARARPGDAPRPGTAWLHPGGVDAGHGDGPSRPPPAPAADRARPTGLVGVPAHPRRAAGLPQRCRPGRLPCPDRPPGRRERRRRDGLRPRRRLRDLRPRHAGARAAARARHRPDHPAPARCARPRMSDRQPAVDADGRARLRRRRLPRPRPHPRVRPEPGLVNAGLGPAASPGGGRRGRCSGGRCRGSGWPWPGRGANRPAPPAAWPG